MRHPLALPAADRRARRSAVPPGGGRSPRRSGSRGKKKKPSGEAAGVDEGVAGLGGGRIGAAPDPVTLSELKRRSREVDQLYAAAQACLQKHALDEALERHNNVVRAADQVVEEFDPDDALREGTDEAAQLLSSVRGTRNRAMAEAVTLLAHAERFESVPQLCTQLLECSGTEQEQMRWLFHRGRAHVKRWEQRQQQKPPPPLEQNSWMGNDQSLARQEANEPNSLIRLALDDFNQVLRSSPDNHEVLQWRAWAHWLMGHHEICAADCDRGLATHPRNVPLLRLRGDALVELQLFRRALNDFDAIVHLFTEAGEDGNRQGDLQDLIRRKHSVAAQFLLQADELTERLLAQIDGKEGSESDSPTAQEDQMGLFHGMLLREGQFTGVIHIGNGITSCKLDDVHKEMLDSALTCMSKHQFKEALAKVKELRELGNEMLRGPLMCFDAELKMNAVQLAMTTEVQGRLEDITPILDYAICIFRESAEAHYHRQALWILATVFIKRGKLRTAVRVLDELIRSHPQYRHSYCQKVELLKADGCSVKEVAQVVQKLEELQDSAPSGDGTGGDASEPEQQGLEAMQADSDEDSGKAQAEARLLLENAKRSLTTMRKDAASGVTQRVREAIQSRIQLIQTEEISRPVLVSLAAAVAYTHAQRFRLAQEMIGKTIKQNSTVAEIFVVRAHVRYTEGSSCDGESAVRCWNACAEDCDHALQLNNECWPALWWKAQALSHLSDTDGKEGCARDALNAMHGLLEYQPSFEEAPEFKADYANLNRKVMLADASQCIESREYEKSLVITSRLLDVSPQHPGALRWRATALGEMLKTTPNRIEPIFRDAMIAEEQILSQTDEQSTDHIDALSRRTETTLEYMERAGVELRTDKDKVSSLFNDLDKALQLDPKHRRSLLLRARLNELLRSPDTAIADCTRVLEGLASDRKLDSTGGRQRLEALATRARAFMQVKSFREAMVDFDTALQSCNCSPAGRDGGITVAALQEQKDTAAKALQAEVNAAQDSLLEELAKDDAAEASAQAKRTRKKAKKLRQQERDKKPAAATETQEAQEAQETVSPQQPDAPGSGGREDDDVGMETIEPVDVPEAASSPAKDGSPKKRNRNRRKGGNKGRQDAAPQTRSPAREPIAVDVSGPPPEQIHAAQEQLAALFSDLTAEEMEAALVKTGYNVEAACNNILTGEESPRDADVLAVGTLLEVADEWEQVSTVRGSSKPKQQGTERCIGTFGKAGLKLRRADLDEACWERLTEIPDSMLVETARQYLHRQRMAKRGQGQPVQNKSAFLMSVVHKLSQKAASTASTAATAGNGQKLPPRKGGKRTTQADESQSPADGLSLQGGEQQPAEVSPATGDSEAPTEEVESPALSTSSPETQVLNEQVTVSEAAPVAQEEVAHTQVDEVEKEEEETQVEEELEQVEVEEEEEVAFGAAPPATEEDAAAEDGGGILFGAAEPEEELMFGAPAAAAAQQDDGEEAQTEPVAAPVVAEPEPEPAPEKAPEPPPPRELEPLELHCHRLRQPGYPAGELELRALAGMLNCACLIVRLACLLSVCDMQTRCARAHLSSAVTLVPCVFWLLPGRIALYARRSAAEESEGGGALAPSESAALAQLEAFLPTNISAAYRRAVLIQVRLVASAI